MKSIFTDVTSELRKQYKILNERLKTIMKNETMNETEAPVKKKCCKAKSAARIEKVRELAYLKWEAANCPSDMADHFWVEAEKEVLDGCSH